MNHYTTLGVRPTATADEIKSAYRRLAMQFHPDRNPGVASDDKFKSINVAYSILGDQEKRAAYDVAFISNRHNHSNSARAAYQTQQTKPQPIKVSITISLTDAYTGGSFEVRSGKYVIVPAGIQNDSVLNVTDPNPNDPDIKLTVFVQEHSLFKRKGDDLYYQVDISVLDLMVGTTIEIPSMLISGNNVSVQIQAGSTDKAKMRLKGYGMPVLRTYGKMGDLYVIINTIVPKLTSKKAIKAVHKLKQLISNEYSCNNESMTLTKESKCKSTSLLSVLRSPRLHMASFLRSLQKKKQSVEQPTTKRANM